MGVETRLPRLRRVARWLASSALWLFLPYAALDCACAVAGNGPSAAAPTPAPTQGKLRLLVMPAFFSDQSGPEPVSQARLVDMMAQVRAYYLEASYDKLDMVPTVTPWIRLSTAKPATGCPNIHAIQAVLASPDKASYRAAGSIGWWSFSRAWSSNASGPASRVAAQCGSTVEAVPT